MINLMNKINIVGKNIYNIKPLLSLTYEKCYISKWLLSWYQRFDYVDIVDEPNPCQLLRLHPDEDFTYQLCDEDGAPEATVTGTDESITTTNKMGKLVTSRLTNETKLYINNDSGEPAVLKTDITTTSNKMEITNTDVITGKVVSKTTIAKLPSFLLISRVVDGAHVPTVRIRGVVK